VILPATKLHVDQLQAQGLLEADRAGNIHLSMEKSTRAFALVSYPAHPVAIFGVGPWPGAPHIGMPWILATDAIKRAEPEILANSKKYLELLGDGFDALSSFVRADRRASIRWMTLMRFQFIDFIEDGGKPYLQTFKYVG
jgi:hypothetical protein